MTLESDLYKLANNGIINDDILKRITVGVQRERDETFTKKWCPLANEIENMVEKASKYPNRATDLLTDALILISNRDSHFGQ